MALVYASSLRMEEAIKSVVHELTETRSLDERLEDCEWRWRMNSIRSSAMSDVLYSPLQISSVFLIGYLQVILVRTTFAFML